MRLSDWRCGSQVFFFSFKLCLRRFLLLNSVHLVAVSMWFTGCNFRPQKSKNQFTIVSVTGYLERMQWSDGVAIFCCSFFFFFYVGGILVQSLFSFLLIFIFSSLFRFVSVLLGCCKSELLDSGDNGQWMKMPKNTRTKFSVGYYKFCGFLASFALHGGLCTIS